MDNSDLSDSSVVEWLSSSLAQLLNFSGTEDIAKYIMTIESLQDVEDYLLAILDKTNTEHVQFIEKFKKILKNNQSGSIKNSVSKVVDNGQATGGARPKKKMFKPQESEWNKNINDKNALHPKKNKKYVPLYSQEGKEKDVIQLAGRHSCECEARKHNLINNCMKCGRIVCEQEGSGPCFFCGNLVCSKAEQEILNRQSKKSQKLYETLLNSSAPRELKNKDNNEKFHQAVRHKDKLLEFDRTSERRTQVIDDEADYYSLDSNKWLSPKERKLLKQKQEEFQAMKYMSRKDRKITLDFAGRQITVNDDVPSVPKVDPKIMAANFGADIEGSKLMPQANPQINRPAPIYVGDVPDLSNSSVSIPNSNVSVGSSRLQSGDLQTMSDQGKGLSMHQPYASMLIAGIKKHEGRTWYTPHRGRLWIASTVKSSTPEENSELENMYKNYGNNKFRFPLQYPPGCLLGCVDVIDCLGQEEYRLNFPNGESLSPYVLICENPQELVMKLPMKGEHKIYKLDPIMHRAAQSAVKRAIS